jgi:hypothetical protein
VPAANTSPRPSGKPGIWFEDRQDGRHFKINYQDSAGRWRRKWLDGPMKLGDALKAREDLSVSIRRREVVVNGEAMRWPQAVGASGNCEQSSGPKNRTGSYACTLIRSGSI